jgi:UMF1 family MFS transporter
LTEKIAIVIGMFSFGFIEELTRNMKNSVLSLIVFFVIGLVWLYSALKASGVKRQPSIVNG